MRSGQVPLEKYVITKTLTKPPEAYPDAKNQPHVLVAQRLKQQGYSSGCSVGDTIPYIICCEQGGSGSAMGIAQCARHPDELKQEQGTWLIGIDYYLSQQIHPVVSRLCASIQGTSPERLADCLGLDASKFQHKSSEALSGDPTSSLLFAGNDEERYTQWGGRLPHRPVEDLAFAPFFQRGGSLQNYYMAHAYQADVHPEGLNFSLFEIPNICLFLNNGLEFALPKTFSDNIKKLSENVALKGPGGVVWNIGLTKHKK